MDVRELCRGKTVLVTGGTGSIGSEIVRQVLSMKPRVVRVYSRDESKQYEMAQELGRRDDVRYLIGDVRDAERLGRAIEGVDLVFHAAALKHVPSCEYNPFEAVKTNVVGTQNLIDAALDEEVERVVSISTDKVANPVNTMGATKLLAEKLVAAANHYKGNRRTVFTCVRFGNVIGSRGSVVPTLTRQIASGGPVTITDGTMRRFMMTVDDAGRLVLKAGAFSRGGETFILKMPVVTIRDLADALIELVAPQVGLRPGDLVIEEIGPRPGEKHDEELLSSCEAARALETREMFIVPPALEERYRFPGSARVGARRYTTGDLKPLSRTEVKALLLRASAGKGGTSYVDLVSGGVGGNTGAGRVEGRA